MKKIGLIGGTGPESTLLYYKEINRLVSDKTDGKHFPEFMIDSVDLFHTVEMIDQERYADVTQYLAASAQRLAASGMDYVAFTAVTCHVVFPEVAALCPVPMVSIPEATAEYAQQKGYKRVGVLGTIYTMSKDYLSKPIESHGIEVVFPSDADKERVSRLIYGELEYGIIKPQTVAELAEVVRRMKEERGIDAVVLGCTELPLALNDEVCPVPCLDTVKIHIDKLVKLITG